MLQKYIPQIDAPLYPGSMCILAETRTAVCCLRRALNRMDFFLVGFFTPLYHTPPLPRKVRICTIAIPENTYLSAGLTVVFAAKWCSSRLESLSQNGIWHKAVLLLWVSRQGWSEDQLCGYVAITTSKRRTREKQHERKKEKSEKLLNGKSDQETCRDTNRGPFAYRANALPTEPQVTVRGEWSSNPT